MQLGYRFCVQTRLSQSNLVLSLISEQSLKLIYIVHYGKFPFLWFPSFLIQSYIRHLVFIFIAFHFCFSTAKLIYLVLQKIYESYHQIYQAFS